jgi:acetyl esterase/lipase
MNLRHVPLVLAMLAIDSSIAMARQAAPPPQPTRIEGSVPYVYKTVGGTELRLHVFSPPAAAGKPAPAVLFFFGGAWTSGTVMQSVPQAKHLARRGMVALIADYRVFGRHRTSPFEAVADAKSAIRWVRTQASKLGVDPSRIVSAGGSAGGHIALGAAVFDTLDESGQQTTVSSVPDVLVLFNPAVDTSHETPAVLKERFLARGRELSPLHHIRRGLPPTLILHGKADATVPYADVVRFCAESRELGNQCVVIGYEGAPHGFFNPGRSEKWHSETLQEMDSFLTRLGYLSPARSPSPRQ